MKRISTLMAIMLIGLMAAKAQPQGFSYQAMLRSPSGEVIANKDVTVKISLRSGALDGKVEYSEVHEVTTSSGGVIAIAVGTGTEPDGVFANIPWGKGIYLQTEVDPGSGFIDMGTSQIMAVPYSLHSNTATFAQTAQTAQEALTATQLSSTNPVIITPSQDLAKDAPLFTVRNSQGKVVFEVYEDGVRANVNNSSSSRSGHGGFVVSDLGSPTDTFMNVSLDGIEFRLADAPGTDGRPQKASFAVGGMAGRGRAEGPNTYLLIEPTGAEINFIETEQAQGRPQKASFAVGGMAGRAEAPNTYLSITPDLTQINLKESTGRPQKASFAVGGMAGRAGESDNLLMVSSDSTRIYIGNAESDGSFAVTSRSNTGLRAQGRNFLNITPKNANITFGGANTSQENIGSFVVGSYKSDGTIKPFMTVQKDKATFNSVHSEGSISAGGTISQGSQQP